MNTEQREGKLTATGYTISDTNHLFLQEPQLKQKVEDESMAIIIEEDEY